MIKRALMLAAFIAAPLAAQDHPADQVSEQLLKGDVETLVGFGTRHTFSVQDDPKRGIGAAVDWGLAEFKRIGAKCGGCLEVVPVGETVMGRGGDQVPFLQKGYPAIRFSVGVEDYDHQHQDLRTENGVIYGDTIAEMDFAYLAGVTKLNVRALDALARAPMPPKVTVDAAVKTYTNLSWSEAEGADRYRFKRRRTDQADWNAELEGEVPSTDRGDVSDAPAFTVEFVAIRGDDWLFGVAACMGEYCSPISSAVPGGAFEPFAKE